MFTKLSKRFLATAFVSWLFAFKESLATVGLLTLNVFNIKSLTRSEHIIQPAVAFAISEPPVSLSLNDAMNENTIQTVPKVFLSAIFYESVVAQKVLYSNVFPTFWKLAQNAETKRPFF